MRHITSLIAHAYRQDRGMNLLIWTAVFVTIVLAGLLAQVNSF